MNSPKWIRNVMGALCALLFGLLLLSPEAEAISPPGKKAHSGWVGPYKVVYTDFQNDAGVKVLATTTAGKTFVEDIYVNIDTAFAKAGLDGGPTAVTMSLGKDGAKTRYKGATTVFTGASDFAAGTFIEDGVGTRIDAYLLTTGTNAAQLTAGEARIYLKISEPSTN